MSSNVKIVIVDDNSFLINAIKEKLSFFDDIQVKYTANNGLDVLEKLSNDKNVDLILMDIEMPIKNGIEATLEIKNKYPQIKIIMLTVFDNDENIFNAIKAGADGYLLKEIDPKGLYSGIQETISGGAAMTPSIALKTLKLLRNPVDFEAKDEELSEIILTPREIEVLEQLSRGLSYSVIAENLFLSHQLYENTLRIFIKNFKYTQKLKLSKKQNEII